jgi:hypothetical protein
MPQNNRIRCDVAQSCITTVTGAVSLQDGSNVNIQVAVALNGQILTDSIQAVRLPSGGGAAEAIVLADFVSEQNDYFEIWVRNTRNDSDVTANSLVIRAGGFVL